MSQLRLLLWKNLLLKRRNLFSAFSEVLLPLSFVFLLVWLQTLDKDEEMYERDWTCPQQSAFSPTLFESPYIENKAVNNSARNDDFFFAVNTEGMGAGVQTVPPFLYVLSLAAKTQSKIALVSSDEETRAWLHNFAGELDYNTRALDKPVWQALGKALSLLQIPFCRFSRLVVFFNSSSELDSYVTSSSYGSGDWKAAKNGCPDDDSALPYSTTRPKLFAAIELNKNKGHFEYALRMNMSVVPVTYPKVGLVDPLQVGVDALWQDNYVLSGFTTLQLQMDRHIIGKKARDRKGVQSFAEHSVCDSLQPLLRQLSSILHKPMFTKIDCMKLIKGLEASGIDLEPLIGPASYIPNQVRFAPFPTPDYVERPFYKKIEDVMSLVLLMCYLWPTSRLIRGIVHEKESRQRESMLQMGVSMFSIMASHLVTYGAVLTLVALLITIITRFNVFADSDPTCVFAFFFLFGCNIVTYSFMVSVLFDRAKTASTAGVSLFFVTYMPFFAVNSPNASSYAKSLVCIFAPTAFGIGSTVLAHYEASGTGVNWGNAWNAPAENDIAFISVLGHLAFDCVLYLALGWYLNQVVSSEFGVRKPYWFLCSARYWRGDKVLESPINTDVGVDEPLLADDTELGGFIEKPSADLVRLEAENRCIKTNRLRKEWSTPSGIKVAVNDLELTFYEGQISVLLAPNGGGKSTTIRMLTGDTPPSRGHAMAFGKNIESDMDALRRSMGVCPQHDVLWEDLTVAEHLQFVGAQKGLNGSELDNAVNDHVKLVGMESKRDALSKSLSGGQKRKLSLAMALIGGSKVVFLDEPTSGMDSHSRRLIWNLLQHSKAGRVIVLTTHFLDEADALGDRIAIMADGSLKCWGTSHFLKNKYGVGYTLTVVTGTGTNHSTLKTLITSRLPESKVLSAMGSELSFQVPFGATKSFPTLFDELDKKRGTGEIEGYGVSVTTLDEVFVKVALGQDPVWAHAEEQRLLNRSTDARESSFSNGHSGVRFESSTFWTQLKALLTKRYSYAKRDRRSVCCNTLIPVFMLIVGLGMLKAFPLPEPPALALTERDALQEKHPNRTIQVAVDSPVLTPFIPESRLITANDVPVVEVNNCSEDTSASRYYDAVGMKRMSTFLREDRFHRHYEERTRYGAIVIDTMAISSAEDELSDDSVGYSKDLIDVAEHAGSSKTPLEEYIEGFTSSNMQHDDATIEVDVMAESLEGLAIHLMALSDVEDVKQHSDSDTRRKSDVISATILANSTAYHSTAIYLNVLNQALLRATTGDPTATLKATNAPFKFTARFQDLVSTFAAVSASISIIMAFSFIPAAVAVFVVREREVAAKHQQLLAGTGLWAYWISNFIFDTMTFLVPWTCSLICVWVFGIDAFNHGKSLVAVAALFLSYGLAIVPFSYLTSFFFDSHSTAQNVVLLINFVTGLVLTIAAFVMSVIESTYKVNRVLQYFYRIFPGFALGNGLLNLTINESKKTFGDGVIIKAESPFAWDVTGSSIAYLLVESILYFVLTVIVDSMWSDPFFVSHVDKFFGRKSSIRGPAAAVANKRVIVDSTSNQTEGSLDEDVEREIVRVDQGRTEDDVVVVKHLNKQYKSGLVAVHDLTFGIKRGDVFALLGVNGAGKSTTLKMLSGEVLPSGGTATVDGLDILLDQARVRRMIGYCPQFDALLDLMTVREHLELFGRLKGVPEQSLDREVRRKMTQLRLEEFENRLAGTLSGGNKRKLSVAIALIGDPPLVLADEPTTGVDALNRRFLCDVLADYSVHQSKGAVVLTTHSMEEVEALGTRVGILAGGKFKCLGSIQHLKNKFGKGLVFRVRLNTPDVNAVSRTLASLGRLSEATSMDALATMCIKLGRSDRIAKLTMGDPTGWVIRSSLDRDGTVTVKSFAQWWVSEDDADRFEAFVANKFSNAELLEKRTGQFVYRLPSLEISLGKCFALFEIAKIECRVQEYSVAGTSLESIFIALAQQDVVQVGPPPTATPQPDALGHA